MKKCIAPILLIGFMQTAQAISTFNSQTNVLNIDSVVSDGIQYNNVTLLLPNYVVLGVGSSAPYVPPVTIPPDTGTPSTPIDTGLCTINSLTRAHYNLITINMTLDQINQIFGCKYDPTLTLVMPTNNIMFTWHYGTFSVNVFFDAYGYRSVDLGNGVWKAAIGF
jgi:hypothetical protein